MATTPTINRAQLGAIVRKWRRRAQLSQMQLGRQVLDPGSTQHQSKLAMIEAGERSPHSKELEAIQKVLGITDPDLCAAMKRMLDASRRQGRWDEPGRVYPESFRMHVYPDSHRKRVDLEVDASAVGEVSLFSMPDLLMCERYIRMIVDVPHATGSVEDRVDARLARTRLLDKADRRFHFLLWEGVVRSAPRGNREVIRRQLEHLRTLSERPNVTIQIVPFIQYRTTPADFELSPGTYFYIPAEPFADAFKYLQLGRPLEDRYVTKADIIKRFNGLFNKAVDVSLNQEDTREYLDVIKLRYK